MSNDKMDLSPGAMKWQICLINGLAQNSKHWSPKLIDALKHLSSVDEVVPLDLPGEGRLSHEPSPTRIAHYIPAMRQFHQQELARSGPRLLVALSLGGMVAAEWCRQFPDDFQRVVFINTSFGRIAKVCERLRPAAWLQFVSIFFGRHRRVREEITLRLVSNHPQQRQETLPVWIDARREYPMASRNALRELYAAWRYAAPDRLPENSLILCSRHDRLCSYRASEKIAKHYGMPLVVDTTPTIGHAFHVDGVRELVAIIDRCVGDRLLTE